MEIQFYHEFVNESITDEKAIFYSFIESFYHSSLLSNRERRVLEMEISNPRNYLINENFFDKLKSRFDKAKQVSKDLSQIAKDALEKLITSAQQATDFIKHVKDILSTNITNILTSTKEKLKSKLKSNKKFLDAVNDKVGKDKSALVKDLHTLKEVVKFYKEKLKDSIISNITKSLTSILTVEDQDIPVTEKLQYIKESGNMISKLVHRLNNIPPFSWIDQLQKSGTRGTEFIIKQLSFITNKLGGPQFTLPVIAIILGIAFEYNIKGLSKQGLLTVVSTFSIPFIGPVIKTIGLIATVIAVYELVVAITSGVEGENELHDFKSHE